MPSIISYAIIVPFIGGALSAFSPTQYTFDPLQHLAGVAPPFDPLDPPLDPSPPQNCTVTRAGYLIRHAAIAANDFDFESYIEPFTQKLANTTVNWNTIPNLSFLSSWKNPITDAEQEMLTRAGKLEATKLGVDIAQRYQAMRTPKQIWTSTAERTLKSAKSLAQGLADEASDISITQISEGAEEGADSLTPYEGCPRYSGSAGSEQSGQFLDLYTKPVIARFNAVAPAFNFTKNDIYAMSLICGYETVIRGSSPFCSLEVLSPNEWLGFEYTNDIMYHYNSGYGSPVTGAVGFPWVNATFNTLMGTQNNMSNATTDQDLYISFTHRELPPMVLVALGLFNNSAFSGANNINGTMPTNTINFNRAWKSSAILPFLSNVAIEKMECASYGYDAGTYYRVIVNDSPQPLIGCSEGPGYSCAEGNVTSFLSERASVVGDFGSSCMVDYSNSTDVLSIYSS